GRSRNEQERVLVVRTGECGDGDEAVAARPVLDHHRLAPARRELLCEQPGGDVGAGGGTKREGELDRALRIGLSRGHGHAVFTLATKATTSAIINRNTQRFPSKDKNRASE